MSLSSIEESAKEAKCLEVILEKGIENGNSQVIGFLKDEIYPSYKIAVQETFDAYPKNESIERVYGD